MKISQTGNSILPTRLVEILKTCCWILFGCAIFCGGGGNAIGQQIDPSADYRFGGITWVQKAAEYRMLTKQTYRYAQQQLVSGLQDPTWTADETQLAAADYHQKRPAIVLDVDETVLDNSAFNARNVVDGQAFSAEAWNQWCLEKKATAIPGALDFVKFADNLGVAIFFITNREDVAKLATVENLVALGFPATLDNVLTVNQQAGRGDDKISRKGMVAQQHRIVLLIGDSMGDLCNDMDQRDYQRRNEIADQKGTLLSTRWIVLPNPVYGGWQRALPSGTEALDTAR